MKYIVLGATGLIGTDLCKSLRERGQDVVGLNRANYAEYKGAKADVLINCNGNTYRYKANQDPKWDFEASVVSVERSLSDFDAKLYIYISTIDVYSDIGNPRNNREDSIIDTKGLDAYGLHKWTAERLVEKYAKKYLIIRLGTALGENLRKGPIFDLLKGDPLQMSDQSQISFIDTNLLMQAIEVLMKANIRNEIFNVTGTGGAKLKDLLSFTDSKGAVSPKAKDVFYSYRINNEKLKALMPVPSSDEIAKKFMNGHKHAFN